MIAMGAHLRTGSLLFFAGLLVREVWCLLLPLDGGNDEIFHLYTASLYIALGRLAVIGQDAGAAAYLHPVFGFEELPYFCQPPVAHHAGAWLLRVTSGPESYMALRQLPVLAGALTGPLAYFTLRLIWRAPSPVPAAAGWLLALAPQLVFVTSYFSDEWLALVAAGVVCLATALVLRQGLCGRTGAMTALGLSTLAVSRLVYWPAGVTPFLAGLWRWRSARPVQRLCFVLWLVLPAMAASSWMARNQRTYGSWSGGMPAAHALRNPQGPLPGFEVPAQRSAREPVGARHPYLYRYGMGHLARSTFMSFWGVYGYMGLLMPAPYYLLWGALCAAACGGLLLALPRLRDPERAGDPAVQFVLVLAVPLLLAALGHAYFNILAAGNAYQPQGRYLFGAAVPVALFLALGLQELLARSGRERWLVPGIAGWAAVANLWSLAVIRGAEWTRVVWVG